MVDEAKTMKGRKGLDLAEWIRGAGSGVGLIGFLILAGIVFGLGSPYFLTVKNMMAIGRAISITAIAAAGETVVLIAGGLDVSIGSVVGLTGVVLATLAVKFGVPLPLACLGALSVGALVGLVNGLIVTKLRINAVITTLATMSIVRGMAFLTTFIAIPVTDPGFRAIARGQLFGIVPVPLVISVLLYLCLYIVLKHSVFGRYVYAIGGNPRTARLAGINVDRWTLGFYSLCGFIVAIAGIVTASQAAGGVPSAGMGTELNIIAAVILGGCSLAGGAGSVGGTFLGVLILGVLANGLTVLEVSPYWQFITRGVALIGAVALDVWRGRMTE